MPRAREREWEGGGEIFFKYHFLNIILGDEPEPPLSHTTLTDPVLAEVSTEFGASTKFGAVTKFQLQPKGINIRHYV